MSCENQECERRFETLESDSRITAKEVAVLTAKLDNVSTAMRNLTRALYGIGGILLTAVVSEIFSRI